MFAVIYWFLKTHLWNGLLWLEPFFNWFWKLIKASTSYPQIWNIWSQQTLYDGRGRANRGRGGGNYQHRSNRSRTCHYCDKPDHFIKFCRLIIAEESPGRTRKQNHHQQQSNNNENDSYRRNEHYHWGGKPSSSTGNAHRQQDYTAHIASAAHQPDNPSPTPDRSTNFSHFTHISLSSNLMLQKWVLRRQTYAI